MSIFSKVWKGIRSVAAPAIGSMIGGPIGGLIGAGLGGSVRPPAASPRAVNGYGGAMPGGAFQPVAAVLPRTLQLGLGAGLPATVGRGAGIMVGAGMAGMRRVANSAATYCRRHPQWCATVGGLAAVEGLVRNGQLPVIKRRRARGISGTELKNFKRVSKTLSKWCKTPPPMKRRAAKCR